MTRFLRNNLPSIKDHESGVPPSPLPNLLIGSNKNKVSATAEIQNPSADHKYKYPQRITQVEKNRRAKIMAIQWAEGHIDDIDCDGWPASEDDTVDGQDRVRVEDISSGSYESTVQEA